MRYFHRREPQHQLNMKKSTLRFLILTALFEVALCIVFGENLYIKNRMTWSEAREYCRKYYTDLSSVSNQEEDEELLRMPYYKFRKIWIGLYQDDSGTWRWSGGKNASFFNWSEQNNMSHRCVAKNARGWHKMNCEENKLRFYCFKTDLDLVKENVTWEEAMEQCRLQHTDLISLPYESALAKTQQVVWGAQTEHLWIGLRHLAGSWLWVNGDNMEYQSWSQGKMPQCPASSRQCGALSLEGNHWNSWDCADKLNFVCY